MVPGGSGSLKGQYWTVPGFILESLIVGRFVVFCWEICSFFVGTVHCCKICSYLLGDLIVTSKRSTNSETMHCVIKESLLISGRSAHFQNALSSDYIFQRKALMSCAKRDWRRR